MADCIFNGTTKRPPLGMAEVTIAMEDPELADAARFVMEGAGAGEKKDSAAEGGENTAKDQFDGDSATGALESEPRSQDAAGPAPALESTQESGGRLKKLFKRKKRNEEKPTLGTKPGESMGSRRTHTAGLRGYPI